MDPDDLFRIRPRIFRVPEPDYSIRILPMLFKQILKLFKTPYTQSKRRIFNLPTLCHILYLNLTILSIWPDPDPGKKSKSDRIRIHNTEI